jgi:hypothetical protein
MICPERATPGRTRTQARDLEQTIAGNVAEILEAGAVVGGVIRLVGGQGLRRVPPLQGEEDLFWPSSQGVAPGYRVVAPLARRLAADIAASLAWVHWCANGAKLVSLGQRPRNTANHKMVSPEGATPDKGVS